VLPSVLLLSGVGLTLMITLRDPLRDTLAFSSFAQGVAAGCVVLALASTLDYRHISGKLSYVFSHSELRALSRTHPLRFRTDRK